VTTVTGIFILAPAQGQFYQVFKEQQKTMF